MCRVGSSFPEVKVPHNNPAAAELNSPGEESDSVCVTIRSIARLTLFCPLDE